MSQVETRVKGDVREFHFECESGHEYSVLAKPDVEIAQQIQCLVDDCSSPAESRGDNQAEISKNPAELLSN